MIIFPKVTKSSARGVVGKRQVKKIIMSLAVAIGIAGSAVASGDTVANAAVTLANSGQAQSHQGAIVFIPSGLTLQLATHYSHRSHSSHRSHYSHYSSRS